MPIFALLMLTEAVTHGWSEPRHFFLTPLFFSLALGLLSLRLHLVPDLPRFADLWLLAPWAASVVTILLHAEPAPHLSLLFMTICLITAGASMLPTRPVAIALTVTLAGQIYCLALTPEFSGSGLLLVPLVSGAVALMIHGLRRRELQATERNRLLERAHLKQAARIERLEHEREQARLEATVRAQTEALEESRRSLRDQEKLAAIGSLAAGVAHQVNNPVGAILAAADYSLSLEDDASGHRERTSALTEIRAQAIRCGRIVKQLMRFARGSAVEKSSVRLEDCLESAVEATRPFVQEQALELSLEMGPGVLGAEVHGNPVELEEVFVNLIRNAAQATAGHGTRIDLSALRTAKGLEILCSDDGPGVPPDLRPRLFDPFFTTRLQAGGSGLGLSLALRILEDHDGSIRCEASRSGGALFRIALPIAKDGDLSA